MSTFRIDNKIYFQCGQESLKMKQMIENPKVALCSNMYSIIGTAKVVAPTKEILNEPLMLRYKELYPNAYRLYSYNSNNLIEVTIDEVKYWQYIKGQPYEGYIYISSETNELTKYVQPS